MFLFAMLLIFSMVSCIGDIDFPGGDDIGGGSGSGDSGDDDQDDIWDYDRFNPPLDSTSKTWQETLLEDTEALFPENVYICFDVSGEGKCDFWKVGKDFLIHLVANN